MGSPLQQHFVLAALQSGFLPLTFRNPVHQRSPIVVWTCHQNYHSDRPSQRRIEHFTWCLTYEHIFPVIFIYACPSLLSCFLFVPFSFISMLYKPFPLFCIHPLSSPIIDVLRDTAANGSTGSVY